MLCPHAGEVGSESGTDRSLSLDSGRCARTAWDDRLEVDNRVGERCTVERLAGYFESGEEEGRCHLRFFREVVRRLKC